MASAASHLECSMKRYNRIKARSPLPLGYYLLHLVFCFFFLGPLPLPTPAKASSPLSTLHKMTGQESYGPNVVMHSSSSMALGTRRSYPKYLQWGSERGTAQGRD
ncbi:hypothetical protein N7471_008565 [Penicillium samsonianum]|uniref:uncharacterized protein n=1 Tax=Penicillium samsonianum TaxID=1882272 RepID=UPI0025495989|nr:uncharacterized protein N7471_008565 [Penicillium samsonianum]KAJ6133350.1 hypothetical protein N7471_008565 [Penicillium samsonianum]